MSWFYCVKSKKENLSDRYRSFNHEDMENKLFTINNSDVYCIAGGLKETCLFNSNESESWVICGTGISSNNSKYYQLDKNSWQKRLEGSSLDRTDLDGHFSIVHISKNQLQVYTDTFGVRKVYYCEDDENYYLSSRMDWLTQHIKNKQINFEELSSYWNLQYILNAEKTFIQDITTAGPEAEITISSDGLTKNNRWWTPKEQNISVEEVINRLEDITTLPLTVNRKPLLGLSGGMDCRTLLAFLDNKCSKETSLFSFGDNSHPDISVAKDISKTLEMNHFITTKELLPEAELFEAVKKHILRTEMHFPVDYYNIFSTFSNLSEKGYTFIDGAAGEFMRNRTGNRLIHRFKLNPSIDPVPLMRDQLKSGRFTFFNSEINNQLDQGAIKALEGATKILPSLKDVSAYQWVDLFLIRYAFWGDSCGYLDSQIPNYMPFAQPSLLEAIYNLPIEKKVNNKINLSIIKKLSPKLAKEPLVRENVKAPYFTSYHNIYSTLWTRMATKLGRRFINPSPLIFFNQMQNTIRERLFSANVKSVSYYDHQILKSEFEKAVKTKNLNSADNILTWLSLDIWRETIENR